MSIVDDSSQRTTARYRAANDRAAGRITLRRIFFENGLSIVLVMTFLACWAGQILVGLRVYNDDRHQRGQSTITLPQYLHSGHFVEATAENWESEFLQMGAFVWLTSFLFQKGSPESKAPYEQEEEPPVMPESPWPARRGGWIATLYGYSLTIAFLVMFLISFLLHAWGGSRVYSEEQVHQGQPPVTMLQYFGETQFWFESLQNWQSEFLAIVMMVVLAIFLRQKGSPESKPITMPHSENE